MTFRIIFNLFFLEIDLIKTITTLTCAYLRLTVLTSAENYSKNYLILLNNN